MLEFVQSQSTYGNMGPNTSAFGYLDPLGWSNLKTLRPQYATSLRPEEFMTGSWRYPLQTQGSLRIRAQTCAIDIVDFKKLEYGPGTI